jgi:hypothetical protein
MISLIVIGSIVNFSFKNTNNHLVNIIVIIKALSSLIITYYNTKNHLIFNWIMIFDMTF